MIQDYDNEFFVSSVNKVYLNMERVYDVIEVKPGKDGWVKQYVRDADGSFICCSDKGSFVTKTTEGF